MAALLTSLRVGWRRQLGRRLTVLIVLFSALVTLILAGLQLFDEYRVLRRAADQQLDNLSASLNTLSNSVWAYDERQIQAALEGIIRLPGIEHAQVLHSDTGERWQAGTIASENRLVRSFPLERSGSSGSMKLAELTVTASLDVIDQQIAARARSIGLSSLITIALVTGFMRILFGALLTRRLHHLSVRVRTLGMQLSPLAAERGGQAPMPDDLDELAAAEWMLDRTTEELLQTTREREAADKKRRESEEHMRTLIDQAPESIVVFDSDQNRLIDANPAAVRLFGCPRETLLGQPAERFLALADGEKRDIVHRARDGELVRQRLPMTTYDGRSQVCEITLVRMGEDTPLLRLSLVDQTARLRAEAQVMELNVQLQAILDAAREVSIIHTDAEGGIKVFNRGAELLLGYSPEEMIGKSPAVFHRESEVRMRGRELTRQLGRPVDGFEVFVALVRDGETETRNWTYIRKNGDKVRVSLAVSAVRNSQGELIGFLGIARDITKQLEAEADLIKINLQLENRVRERTSELQQITEQLQATLDDLHRTQAQLVQSEKLASLGSLVAAVAHEMNTPIGNCLTTATSMQMKTAELSADVTAGALRRSVLDSYLTDANQAMDLLTRGLERCAGLVANFKQVATDARSLTRRRFQLDEMLGFQVALLRSTFDPRRFVLNVSCPPGLAMDSYPEAIDQIIGNWVTNALTHAFAEREHGVMSLSVEPEAGNWVCLRFADDGCGMSEEVTRHVFDPFFTTQLGKGGSGLGMYICYNLATGPLGGELKVSSTPGVGTVYSLRLPMCAPA